MEFVLVVERGDHEKQQAQHQVESQRRQILHASTREKLAGQEAGFEE
jgi:hypothetical protein